MSSRPRRHHFAPIPYNDYNAKRVLWFSLDYQQTRWATIEVAAAMYWAGDII